MNAGEVAADVALQDIFVFANALTVVTQCAVSAFIFSVGVAVVDEGALKNRLDDLAEGVVDNSIAVGCGGNNSRFGFVNLKVVVFAGLVCFLLELSLEFQEIVFETVVEGENLRAKSF